MIELSRPLPGGFHHEGPYLDHGAFRQGADSVYPVGADGYALVDDGVAVFRVDNRLGHHPAPEIRPSPWKAHAAPMR